MYRIILCLTLFPVLFACSDEDSQPATATLPPGKYSDSFNRRMNSVMENYFLLSEALVRWDSTEADRQASRLVRTLDSTGFDEMKKDSMVYMTASGYVKPIQNDLQTIIDRPDITEKRQAFNSVTQQLYDILRVIRYDRSKIYLNECTMPYNDAGSGHWLSRSADSLRNPYLGLYHPKYKKGMLNCGITRDSVNYISSR